MSYVAPHCRMCGVQMTDELDVTPETLLFFDRGGVCLSCELDESGATYWQHDDSDCVWTASPDGGWSVEDMATLDPAVDELFKHQFFERVEAGWSYSFGHPSLESKQ